MTPPGDALQPHAVRTARRRCRELKPGGRTSCYVMRDFLRVAFQPSVVRRGLRYAMVVGSVLISINHGDAILRGDVDGSRLRRIALTVVVPYLVSTFSSVGAIRELRGSKDASAPEDQDARRYHATSSGTG